MKIRSSTRVTDGFDGTPRVSLQTTLASVACPWLSGRIARRCPFAKPEGAKIMPWPTTGRVLAEWLVRSSTRQSSLPVSGSYA
jgi:hypothetical protein